jgi:hypothetical protein
MRFAAAIQLARQFGALLSQGGNDVWIGHPHMVGWRLASLNDDLVAALHNTGYSAPPRPP